MKANRHRRAGTFEVLARSHLLLRKFPGQEFYRVEVTFSKREASLVLAALRNWQEESQSVDLADYYEAYFEEHEPLESEEIDSLCRRIAEASARERD